MNAEGEMSSPREPINVVLVEDNLSYLNELSTLLSDCNDINVVGKYTHGNEAIKGIIKNHPEVVLIDMELPDISGVEVISSITDQGCTTEFLVLTVFDDDTHLFAALQAGALGYIVKGLTPLPEIEKAIHDVIDGGAPMSRSIAKRVLETFKTGSPKQVARKKNTKFNDLTKRETQILEYVTRGYSTKKVAEDLNISYETVRTHLKNIYQKLHVHTLVEAMHVFRED